MPILYHGIDYKSAFVIGSTNYFGYIKFILILWKYTGLKKDKTKKPLDQITANRWGFYFEQIPPNAPNYFLRSNRLKTRVESDIYRPFETIMSPLIKSS